MPFCCSTVEEEEPAIICSTRPGPQVARLVRDDHQGAGRATGMLEMDEVDAAMTMPTKPLKDYDDGFDSDSDEELYSDGTNLAELSIDLQIPAARAKPRNPPFKVLLVCFKTTCVYASSVKLAKAIRSFGRQQKIHRRLT